MGYHIKPGYRENPRACYFLDDVTTERGIVFQPDVYTMAEMLVADPGGLAFTETVIDIGCGWGDKLAGIHDRHPSWHIFGYDYGANIEHCRSTYDWGRWVEHDLEQPLDLSEFNEDAVIICSDVIEHLVDPTNLVHAIRDSGVAYAVISTPERDIQWGYDHRGPSNNLCHIREWNAQELNDYLRDEGLNIAWHGLTRGSDQGWAMATQIVVVRP